MRVSLQEANAHYEECRNFIYAAQKEHEEKGGGGGSQSQSQSSQSSQQASQSQSQEAAGPGEVRTEVKPVILLHKESLRRDKRCLMAYHMYRARKVADLRWEAPVIPPHYRHNLHVREVEFFASYDKILCDYGAKMGVDLTGDVQPPKELYVEVRVLKSCGEIVTENGPVVLDVGSTHFLKRSDVEHLIRQGVVQQLSNEEC